MYFVLQALAIAVLGSLPIAKLGYALPLHYQQI